MMRIAQDLYVVAFVGLAACGGMVGNENRSTGTEMDAATTSEAAPGEDAANDASALDATPDSPADYAGLLRATIRSHNAKQTYTLDISFWRQEPPLSPPALSCGKDGVTVGSCCAEAVKIPLLDPPMPLSAGDVTISIHGTPLTTLLAPDYPEIDDATWNGGDVLGVFAAGGNIAPFSGSLETPAVIAGVTPSFDSPLLTIPSSADLRVSWTPEAKDGERMQLQIDAIGTSAFDVILCEAPDSAGAFVVDATLLARITSSSTGNIHLTRSITSNASGANVNVTLLGEAWADGLAIVQ